MTIALIGQACSILEFAVIAILGHVVVSPTTRNDDGTIIASKPTGLVLHFMEPVIPVRTARCVVEEVSIPFPLSVKGAAESSKTLHQIRS